MPDRDTADAQLGRILALLPLAAREDGVRTAELAEELGTSESQLLRDLEEVYTRAYYHPAGGGDDPQVLIEHDRVSVWTKGEFRRPVRLLPREALALHLGLALLARESGDEAEREALLTLAARLETQLASAPSDALLPHLALESGTAPDEQVHAVVAEAARERRACRIRYLKPGRAEPDDRVVDPYVLVVAEGTWYAIGRCHREDAVRTFRLDRVLYACADGAAFEVPDTFDPAPYTATGRVFRADAEVEAEVRYGPAIARWIAERAAVEPEADGSVVLRHRVADPRWIVRHVLQYGPDARLERPPEFRVLVRDSAARMAAAPG